MTADQTNTDLRVLFNNLNGVLSDVAWVRELDTLEKRAEYISKYFPDAKQKLADAQRTLSKLLEAVEPNQTQPAETAT